MDEYILTFQLKNYPDARNFLTEVSASEETLKSAIFEKTKYFSELYGTPVKCIKSVKTSAEKTPAGVV